MSPESGHRWFTAWLPMAREAGPFVTLLLAIALVVSLWWGIGILRECVRHNRELGAKLVAQQEKFHTELVLRLAHCPPPR